MKTSITLMFFIFSINIFAKDFNETEKKEIIGSGIFSINSTRSFSIEESTDIYLDNNPIDYNTFEIIGSGFKAKTNLLDDVNDDITIGTVYDINLTSNIHGPVTSLSPLMILEQPVLITSDTIQSQQDSFQLYQELLLSGYTSKNNSVKATKVMDSIYHNWKIQGYVSQVNRNRFNIGTLVINRNNEEVLGCSKGIKNGLLIEVQIQADSNYQIGGAIDTLLSVKCIVSEHEQNILMPMVVQGFVTQKQGNDFWMNDVYVNNTNDTVFENGEKGFINSSVNVEVQGLYNTETSELNAEAVRFIDHRIELTFPVYPSDIVLNQSISVNGLVFNKTPHTIDNNGVLINGLNSARQVEIQGFIDTSGEIYISKLKLKGPPNYNLVSLRGNINDLSQPLFSLLNFQIDAGSNTLNDNNHVLLETEEFFQSMREGIQIEVKHGEYSQVTNEIVNATITIKSTNESLVQKRAEQSGIKKEIIGSGIVNASVTGTITRTAFLLNKKKSEKLID